MKDFKEVPCDHQRAIERVLQKKSDKENIKGHQGKMGKVDKADWLVKDKKMTPKKA